MKILYLVNRDSYHTKMSRVRFHGIKALSKITDVRYWGINWPNYNQNLTVQQNLDNMQDTFDAVIAYKPLELKEFNKIKPLKVIRYNEMYDVDWTLKEIKESGSQLVICHHLNDCERYKRMNIEGVKFVYVGHCAEKTIFKNYNLDNEYDVLIAGRLSVHYPLRNKFLQLIPYLEKRYRCHIHPHPGYDLSDAHTDRYLKEMAVKINKARITLTDTGIPRSRYGKYIEIPMCGVSAICGDLPDDKADDYGFVIEVSNDMTHQQIFDTICHYLDNENLRLEKVKKGIEFSKNYTQEHYAERIFKEIKDYLKQ